MEELGYIYCIVYFTYSLIKVIHDLITGKIKFGILELIYIPSLTYAIYRFIDYLYTLN